MKNILSKLSALFATRNQDVGKKANEHSVTDQRPPFIPVNRLEILLVAAATEPSVRPEFNRELLRENMLVATPVQPAEIGERVLEKDEVLSIMNVQVPDGLVLPAIFSSEQRLAECFGVGTGYVAMPGAALFEIVQEDGAVLNPASAYGVQWSSADLAVILGRPVRRVIKKDTRVTLGAPSHHPDQLVSKLSAILDADSRVQEAWLALAHWPESDEWSWYLDIRSNLSPDEISPSLAEACRPEFLEGKAIDIVANSPVTPTGVGIRLKPATSH